MGLFLLPILFGIPFHPRNSLFPAFCDQQAVRIVTVTMVRGQFFDIICNLAIAGKTVSGSSENYFVGSESFVEPGIDGGLFYRIQFADVILELVDPGTDRERDPDGADDRFAPVEGLDLDLHL